MALQLSAPVEVDRQTRHEAFPGAVRLGSGHLLACWRSAANHATTTGAGRGVLYGSRSTNGGRTWSPPVVLVDESPHDVRGAMLTLLSDGRVALVYWVNDGLNQADSVHTYLRVSTDDGYSWSAAVHVDSGMVREAVESPIVEHNGRLLLPLYAFEDGDPSWSAVLVASDDGGETWENIATLADGPGDGRNYTEPYLQKLADGTLVCLMREDVSNVLHRCVSDDGGETWTAPHAMFPGSARPSFIEVRPGLLMLFYRRHAGQTADQHLLARTSTDGGVSWSGPTVLDDRRRFVYGQPYLTPAGDVGLLWGVEWAATSADIYAGVVTIVPDPTPAPPDPEPGPPVPVSEARPRQDVVWLACDATSGRIIAELPEVTGPIGRILGGHVSTSLTVPIPTVGPRGATLSERARLAVQATAPARTMIVAVVNDVPAWGGLVLARKGGTEPTLELSCVTPEGYLDRRTVGDHDLRGVDEATIMATLARDAEAIDGQGQGLGLIIDAPATGTRRDRTYVASDRATVLDRMRELMGVQDGPEFTIDLEWDGADQTRVVPVLRVRKRIGRPAATPNAIFDTYGRADVAYTYLEDYSDGRGANWVVAYSTGEGDDQPVSRPAIDMDALTVGAPIYERHWQPSSSIRSVAVLDGHAVAELDRIGGGTRVWELDVRWDATPRYALDWYLGDDVGWMVAGHLHPDGVYAQGRIIGWELDLQEGRMRPTVIETAP